MEGGRHHEASGPSAPRREQAVIGVRVPLQEPDEGLRFDINGCDPCGALENRLDSAIRA